MSNIRRAAASALLIIAGATQALTIGYDVVVQNMLSVPVTIELSQYHSERFNGTRPSKFTEDLLIYKKQILLAPNSSQSVHYTSASGGFWLQWKHLNSGGTQFAEGVLELAENERVIQIKQ